MAPLRLGVLLGQPTQFEGPFFRHASESGTAQLTVLYVGADQTSSVYDPELGRTVSWGVDLLAGYEHKTLPRHGRLRWLWNELRRERYDWLIINGYAGRPYLWALAIARLRGIRTGLRIDSVLYNAASPGRRFAKHILIRTLSRLYDRFFVTGTLARDYLLHFGVAPHRIAWFPYAVDTAYFAARAAAKRAERAALRERLGVPATARVLLAVAKFNRREAPWDLLGALEGMERADVWTVLVGDGEMRERLAARVAERGLRRVVFAGYVAYTELASCYAMADVFVHAAVDEPWGVSVHEAIACGLPVVASSRVGAGHDLIRSGRNGYLYDAGDADQLRARLADALELDSTRIGEANREVLARWNYARAWSDIMEAVS